VPTRSSISIPLHGINSEKKLSIKAIARVFEIQPKDLRNALAKGDAIPKGRGEHPALEDDTEKLPLEWIPKNAQNHAPVNRTEVLNY
jgi:hypothetical protein